MTNWPQMFPLFYTKHVTNCCWGIKHFQNAASKGAISAVCPCCKHQDKTAAHVLVCEGPTQRKLYFKSVEKLRLYGWRRSRPIPALHLWLLIICTVAANTPWALVTNTSALVTLTTTNWQCTSTDLGNKTSPRLTFLARLKESSADTTRSTTCCVLLQNGRLS